MSQGLSVANNLLANSVELHLDYNQGQLATVVTQLSSGLRINSAADDPSGLAIADSLQSQVGGFNEAVQNVQNANNAVQVALGAMTSQTNILQRIRNLAIEAASDINSQNDRANLQTEVTQLLLEINRIAQDTNFNGQPLLDGSHAGFQPEVKAYAVITANTVLFGGHALSSSLINGSFSSPSIPANSTVPGAPTGWTGAGAVAIFNGNDGFDLPLPGNGQGVSIAAGATLSQTLVGLTPGATYSISFLGASAPGAPGAGVQVLANGVDVSPVIKGLNPVTYTPLSTQSFTAPSSGVVTLTIGNPAAGTLDIGDLTAAALTAPQNVNAQYLAASVVAANVNFNTTIGTPGYSIGGAPYATVDGTIELQVVNTGVSVAVQETFINSATGRISVDSHLYGGLQISSDFENLDVTTGSITANDVGSTAFIKVSQNVAAQTNPKNPALIVQSAADEGDVVSIGIAATSARTLRVSNINVAISAANNPSLGAEDAIGQVDIALQTLLSQQAQLGAVVVRLNYDVDNDESAATNLQASESQIRDLDVGQATTEFTKLQVLVQVGTSVLAQTHVNADSVLTLFR